MSARKLKPSSSRQYRAASSSRSVSTTTVVSPYSSASRTKPGMRSHATTLAAFPTENAKHFSRQSRGRLADLVRGRHSGEDLLLQADDALEERLRPRRAARHVDVHGDDLVDALEDRVVAEHAAGARAGAHRDHPLRLEHLVVDLAERPRHLVGHAPGDDEQVRLPRRGAEALHPEARDVVARRDD